MKTSDIPDEPILKLLAEHQGYWTFWGDDNRLSWPSESMIYTISFPIENVPRKLIHSKWKSLIRRGLIGGCDCGCRGDFEITDKGLESLGQKRIRRYNGY
jgi:hypothetical protein